MPRSASFLPCVCTEAVCCGHPGDPSASPSRPVTCSFGPQQQLVSRPATVRPDPHRRGSVPPAASRDRGPAADAVSVLPQFRLSAGAHPPARCSALPRGTATLSTVSSHSSWMPRAGHIFQVGLPAAALPEPRVWDSAGLRPGLRAGASAGPSLPVPPGHTRAGSTPVQPRPSGCVGARPRLRETPPKGPPNPSRGHLCALRMSLTRRTCTGHSL